MEHACALTTTVCSVLQQHGFMGGGQDTHIQARIYESLFDCLSALRLGAPLSFSCQGILSRALSWCQQHSTDQEPLCRIVNAYAELMCSQMLLQSAASIWYRAKGQKSHTTISAELLVHDFSAGKDERSSEAWQGQQELRRNILVDCIAGLGKKHCSSVISHLCGAINAALRSCTEQAWWEADTVINIGYALDCLLSIIRFVSLLFSTETGPFLKCDWIS